MTKAGGKSKKTDVTELENPIIVAIPPIPEAESNEADVKDDKKSKSKKRKNKEEATAEIPEEAETDPAALTDDSENPKPTKKATKKVAAESEPVQEPIIVATPQVVNGEVKKRGRKKKVVEVESAEGADAVLESVAAPVPNVDVEIVKPVNAKTKKANSKASTTSSSTQITDHVLLSEPVPIEEVAIAGGELTETLGEPVVTVRKVVRRLQDWNIHYAAILEYFKEFGTCDVPKNRSYECDLPGMGKDGGSYHYTGKLGKWLNAQRQAKKGKGKATLSPERDAKLQQLVDEGKMMWDASALSSSVKSREQGLVDWPRHYAALIEYCKEHNTCNVPYARIYECELIGLGDDGGSFHYVGNLGKWLHAQRTSRKALKARPKLLPERESLLQQLVDDGKLLWEIRTWKKRPSDNEQMMSSTEIQVIVPESTFSAEYASSASASSVFSEVILSAVTVDAEPSAMSVEVPDVTALPVEAPVSVDMSVPVTEAAEAPPAAAAAAAEEEEEEDEPQQSTEETAVDTADVGVEKKSRKKLKSEAV